jgi:glutathione S-transferase
MSTEATPTLTAFDWVPDFARGLVRDLRVRWAFEELGQPYAVEKLQARGAKPDGYARRQPFEQVPALTIDGVEVFESGAMLLYLAEKHGALLPDGEQDRWTAKSWLFSAFNSVEPFCTRLFAYDVFMADQPWSKEARVPAEALVQQKLKRLDDWLADRDWLAGSFSIADIAMITVLENLRVTDLVARHRAVAAYVARGEARPAFQRALAAQSADFDGQPPQF